MVRKLSLALGLGLLCALTISGARKPKLTLSFHLEGARHEGPKFVQPMKVGNPAVLTYFRRSPSLTNRHVQGYYPFPSPDGNSFGVAFKLNQNGSDVLSTLSMVGQGRKLLAVLNSEPVDVVLLDKPVRDGYLVFWSGFTKSDMKLFDKEFKRLKPEKDPGSRSLMPERATDKEENTERKRLIRRGGDGGDSSSGTGKTKKKRKRLLNFGRGSDDS